MNIHAKIFILFNFAALVFGQQYQPNWTSLDTRPTPTWYDESKFGIFVHWGVYSVPAFTDEWFWWHWKGQNQSDVLQFMATHYKPGTTYADFAKDFTAIDFDANNFAQIIKSSGAKYFVITTKHHEGYTLWPSAQSWNWNSKDVGSGRDLIGELRQAILNVGGIHWGTYFSLQEWFNPLMASDMATKLTQKIYPNTIVTPQLYDLVNNYLPDILWTDGDTDGFANFYPDSNYWGGKEFLAWLYNESPVKDVVVTNDRWGTDANCKHGSFFTCSDNYIATKLQDYKWENCDKIDCCSWGYRRNMDIGAVKTTAQLIKLLISTIAMGGNFLLNFPPDPNGRVIPVFEERLRDVGHFVNAHSDAIFATKPWIFQNDFNGTVWYTSTLRNSTGFDPYRMSNPQQEQNTVIYAIVLDFPSNDLVQFPSVIAGANTQVSLISTNNQLLPLPITNLNPGIQVNLTGINVKKFPSLVSNVIGFKIEYAATQCPYSFVQSTTNPKICLAYVNETRDWASANAKCVRLAPGASLVSVDSSFADAEIRGLIPATCSNAWIGYTKTGTTWAWSNGDPSAYVNWEGGYPTADANATCAGMNQNDGKWINKNCATPSCFLCTVNM